MLHVADVAKMLDIKNRGDSMGMSEKHWSNLCEYIRRIADLLGLKDWSITPLNESPDDPMLMAEVETVTSYKNARIRFREDFQQQPPGDQRQTVIHELLHLHMLAMVDVMRMDLPASGYLPQSAHDFFYCSFQRGNEAATDAIAVAIATKYPLISWDVESQEA